MGNKLIFMSKQHCYNFGVNGCDSKYQQMGDPKNGYSIEYNSVESMIVNDILSGRKDFSENFKQRLIDGLKENKGVSFELYSSDADAEHYLFGEGSGSKLCSIHQKPAGIYRVDVSGYETDIYSVQCIEPSQVAYLPVRCFTGVPDDKRVFDGIDHDYDTVLRCDTSYYDDLNKASLMMKHMQPTSCDKMGDYSVENIVMLVVDKSMIDDCAWYKDSQRVNQYQDKAVYGNTFDPIVGKQVELMRRHRLDMTLSSETDVRRWNEEWDRISGGSANSVDMGDSFDF